MTERRQVLRIAGSHGAERRERRLQEETNPRNEFKRMVASLTIDKSLNYVNDWPGSGGDCWSSFSGVLPEKS